MSKHQDDFRKLADLCREHKVTVGDGSDEALRTFLTAVQTVCEPFRRLDSNDSATFTAFLLGAIDATNARDPLMLAAFLQKAINALHRFAAGGKFDLDQENN